MRKRAIAFEARRGGFLNLHIRNVDNKPSHSFFFRKNWPQDPCAIPTFTKPKICQIRAPCILEGDVGSAFKRKLAPRFSLRQPKVSLLCKEKQAPRPFYQTIECGSSKQSHHLHFRQVKPSISQCQTFFFLS